MAGTVLRATPKRLVNFSTLATGAQQELVLTDRVPVVDWRELTMIVQVYSSQIPSGAAISIRAYPQSVSADDPGLFFIDARSPWEISLPSTTPACLSVPIASTSVGALLRITARGSRGAAAGAITAGVSVCIAGKDG